MDFKEIKCKKCHKTLDVKDNEKIIICDSCGEENQITEENKEIAEIVGKVEYTEINFTSKMIILSIFLIIISITILVIGSYYNSKKEGEDQVINKTPIVTTTVKSNVETKEFNKVYEGFVGTYPGGVVNSVCSLVKENNNTNELKIDLVIDGVITSNLEELSFDTLQTYEISLEYSNSGYVNKVIINTKEN